jgi:predicted permease
MALSHVLHALRLIRLNPGSSAAIILTLALAIGANGTLFTLINAALLSPLPIRDADRFVNIYTSASDGSGFNGLSFPDYEDLVAGSAGVLEDALGYSGLMATITGDGASEIVFGELVTPNYFSLLGVRLQGTRDFSPASPLTSAPQPAVVISDRYWRRRFNADPAALGAALPVNGRPYTIVGVAPAGFPGLLFRAVSADVWIPVSMMGALRTDQRANRGERWMFVRGKLKPDATPAEARAAAGVIASRLQRDYPDTNTGRSLKVVPTSDVIVHPDGDRAVFAVAAVVMSGSALVLLVACANVAGVMLARGLARRREIAIRLAIGAQRADVARQLLVEGAVLSVFGGIGGLVIARWCASLLASWRPDLPVPISIEPAVDLRVTIFTLAVTALATVLFAIVPAVRSARTPAEGSMQAGASRGRRRLFGLREAILVPQIAIGVALVAAAGLLARSLARADAVETGFDADRTAFIALNLGSSGYDEARAARFYQDFIRTLEQNGTATAAAPTSRLPLDLYGDQSATVSIDDEAQGRSVQVARIGDDYLAALGISVLRGRAFEPADSEPGRPAVAIVSAAAAREYWPDADPIGRRVRFGAAPSAVVVGVAADVRVRSLGESPQPFVYLPWQSGYASLQRIVARSTGDPARAVDEMRRLVRQMDPNVAVFEARTLAGYLDVMLYPYRAAAALGATFGVLAMALAGIGLYGVLACGVTERLREVAIRLALGAQARSVIWTAASETARAAILGTAAGALLALAAGRLLSGVLFGISPFDPITLLATSAALIAVVGLASAGPLRRALRAELMETLRT